MPCDECQKLQDEEANTWRALQEQRTVNREWNLHGKQAGKAEQDLERLYNLARAKNRLHKGTHHPDECHTVSIEDLNIVVRSGRTRP